MKQHHQVSPFVNCHKPTDWQPGYSGSLNNLRLAVKDLFDIAGTPTGAGNPDWLRDHTTPQKTASVVKTLLMQGADYVGKTITDELAYSLNGLNIHYPRLVNSLDPQRICGGSTSGSALAVAQNLADIGLGTDTGGSIRVPASYNGLFGFRPTHGLVQSDGLVPLAPGFDTIGWLTRDISKLQLVAKTLIKSGGSESLFTPVTLGAAIEQCDYSDQLNSWLTSSFGSLNSCEISFETLEIASEAFRVLQGREIWQTHGNWIEKCKPQFAQDIQNRLDWCKTLTKQDELQAFDRQNHFKTLLTPILEQNNLIVLPTAPGAAPKLDSDSQWLNDYRNKLMAFTCIAGLAGLPQIHLPLFNLQGKAYGVSLIAKRHSDLALIDYAKRLLES